ncbi:MAG: NAD(P)H-hydrate dehydratase [Planctomycetia bacterium]|nr:NAD(P)H-hydrate dehydratase [Planctomycetia bacterium]
MPGIEVIERLPTLPPRAAESNKGSFGKVLVVAGSRGMSGAAVLCASAALRGGAGLVYLAVPAGIQPIVAMANPCYLTLGLPEDSDGKFGAALPALTEALHGKDVLALGPGLGQSAALAATVRALVASCPVPLVLDADGLNALVGHTDVLSGPRILTPHPGEFARLLGVTIAQVQAARQSLAVEFAARHRIVLVLKGHRSLVTDGRRVYINQTGNPGMATGGTGDVLTGLIAALLGQGLEPFAAAQLGVYWHGLAGDLARDAVGEVSLIASDVLDCLPRALRG